MEKGKTKKNTIKKEAEQDAWLLISSCAEELEEKDRLKLTSSTFLLLVLCREAFGSRQTLKSKTRNLLA